MFKFLFNMFTTHCCAPGCDEKGTEFPHGIPCCEKHYHPNECLVWLGDDCDCGKESDG